MKDQDLILIEKFLTKELSQAELIVFQQRLDSDLDFRSMVIAQKNIEDVLSNNELKKFEQTLATVEKGFYVNQEPTYSLSDLLEMFKTVPDYEEELIASTTRSCSRLRVLSPNIGENFDKKINFILSVNAPEDLTISIENTSEDIVGEYVINEGVMETTIPLTSFLPGRYYWKLFGDSVDMFLGSFLVSADLMPEE